jgi:hypothetical protein
MRNLIGLGAMAVAAAFATPSLAETDLWYVGRIADGGFVYVDAAAIEKTGDAVFLIGLIVYPPEDRGLYAFEADIECGARTGFFERLEHSVGETWEPAAPDMTDDELQLALKMGCSDRAQWPGLGFQPVTDLRQDFKDRSAQ